MFRTLGERKSKPTKIVELKNIIVYLNLKMTSVLIEVIFFTIINVRSFLYYCIIVNGDKSL
jgi:hypothetical protein